MNDPKISKELCDSSECVRDTPENIAEPRILLEEEDFLICLKPPGIPTPRREASHTEADQEATRGRIRSLADWIAAQYPECEAASHSHEANGSTKNPDCGVCHRLDTETSGVMLVAKTPLFYNALREAFHAGKVEKDYLCLVEGRVKQEQEVQGYLYGRYRRSQKVHVSPHEVPRSQLAKLHLSPEKHLRTNSFEASLLKIHLITGFRHQIRAQLAGLGHPLVGDSLYGSTRSLGEILRKVEPYEHLSRTLLLHAERIAFHHPVTKKRIEVRLPLESEF